MPSTSVSGLPDLLRAVAMAADIREAAGRVLGLILQEAPLERGILALESEGVVRGAGLETTDGPRGPVAGEDGEDPFDAVLRACAELAVEGSSSSGAGTCPVRDRAIVRALGGGDCVAVAVPGVEGDRVGCLVIPGVSDDALPAVREILEATGPLLERLLVAQIGEERGRRIQREFSLLDRVVQSFPDPVVVTDRANNFHFTNRRAEHLFSAISDDSEGRRRAVQINDLLFTSFLTQTVMGAVGAEGDARELNLVDPQDGSDLLFEVITLSLPFPLEDGEAVISILRDITDLKKAVTELETQFTRSRAAEQASRRESERLNAILANVDDPILVTDHDTNLVLMNREAERLFEEGGDDGGGQRRSVRANDARFTSLISDFLLTDRERMAENVRLRDPASGEEIPMEVVSSKITDRRGEVSTVVSVLHDLTALKENERLAEELRALNEGLEERIRLATEELEERNRRLEWQSRELQKASRLKSEFLASMSHELRTPINAMLGYTSLLRERIYGELNERQEQALSKIHTASEHLLALINDILDLSKIEAGKMPVKIEEIRLETVIGELSQTIEPMVREKELEYRTEVFDNLPMLRTDRTKVKQILLNLLSNAVKFTQQGGITLRARPADGSDRIRLEVEDTGIGISQGQIDEIFQDFRQVDQSSTRQFGGTGLGLSITRKLVHLLGGTISVESEEGEGSLFVVELPVRLEGEEAGEPSVDDLVSSRKAARGADPGDGPGSPGRAARG